MEKNYLFSLVLIVVYFLRGIHTIVFTHHVVLDPEGNYKMWWKFDDVDITFKVKVKTTGKASPFLFTTVMITTFDSCTVQFCINFVKYHNLFMRVQIFIYYYTTFTLLSYI